MKTLVLAIFLCTNCIGQAFAEAAWPSQGSDCVRWHVQKRMFLVKETKVSGYNCAIKLTVAAHQVSQGPVADGEKTSLTLPTAVAVERTVSVTIPLNRFDSGEPERDAAVTELLGRARAPSIQFTSSPLNVLQWQSLADGALKRVDGTLDIKGSLMPMSISLRYDSTYIFGEVRTAFSRLNITPPVVAGGAIAKVRDSLRLEFRVARATMTDAASH